MMDNEIIEEELCLEQIKCELFGKIHFVSGTI